MEIEDCEVILVLRGFGVNVLGDLRENAIKQIAKDLKCPEGIQAYIKDTRNVGVLVMPRKIIV